MSSRKVAVAVTLAVAVGIRALNAPELYRERVFSPSSDAYHYRAALDGGVALASEPDRGMHALLAALDWVPIAVLTWLPVLAGALTVLVVAWTGRELANERVAVVAALLVAVAPAHALYSSAGMLDHHAVDHLLFALALAASVRALDDRRWLAVVAATLTVAVAVWEGALVTTVAPLVIAGAAVTVRRWHSSASITPPRLAVAAVLPALAGVALVVAKPALLSYLFERAVDDLLGRSRTVESRGLLTPAALVSGVPLVFGGVTLAAGLGGLVTTVQSRRRAWRFLGVTAGVCVALSGLQTRFLGVASVPLALVGAYWLVGVFDRHDLSRVDTALAILVLAGVGIGIAVSLVGTAGVHDDRAAAALWLDERGAEPDSIAARIETTRVYRYHAGGGLRHGGGHDWRQALRGDVPDGIKWVVVDGPPPPGSEKDWHDGVATVAYEKGSVTVWRVDAR